MSHNPFSGWRVTGDWADHMPYSLGGTDYPLPFGSALPAPASGTLRTSGGTGERKAGLIGSAGRRSILDLDTPLGDMVSIVFQHQSRFGEAKHYEERETIGWSGASTIRANGTVNERGGDVHLHIHGLDKDGNRVDFTTHISSATSGESITQIIPEEDEDMASGIYTRIGSGQGTGTIYHQEHPGAPLYAMVGPEWAAASANGNKYSNVDAPLVHELMRRVGVFKRELKYGRIIRDAAGQPIVDYPG